MNHETFKLKINGDLEECGIILEKAINKLKNESGWNIHYDTSQYVITILDSNHDTKTKKRLILTIINAIGITSGLDDVFIKVLDSKDFNMLRFLLKHIAIKPNRNIIYTCKNLGRNETKFVLKCLTSFDLCLSIQKAFLYGAIEKRNMEIITFIVEHLHIDIFIPTYQKSSHSIGAAFATNDDLELLQWFEDHDYNIHECQRTLLNTAYAFGAKRIIKYVLAQQSETEAANLFMEQISTKALLNDDTELLTKFSKISLRVTQNTVVNALTAQKGIIYIRALFERYIEILTKQHARWNNSTTPDGKPKLFDSWNVKRYYNLSQYGETWEYLASKMYEFGSAEARTKLASLGYSP